jgi:MFS family permease
MMVSWGIVITLQGIVQEYHGLIFTRVILGVAESGFFPAATYLVLKSISHLRNNSSLMFIQVTTWYCRFELQRRLAVFYSAASLAGAFSGILAYGIQHMEGVGGLEGWRWMYVHASTTSYPTH